MSSSPALANVGRRQLVAEIEELRGHLDRYAGRIGKPPREPEDGRDGAASTPLDRLCDAFDLEPFERAVIVLCAGCELDGDFAASCAAAQGGRDVVRPTIGLAIAALPEADWSAFAPLARLRDAALVTVRPRDEIVHSTLAIDEPLLHYLIDGALFDPEILKVADPLPAPEAESRADADFARDAVARWSAGVTRGTGSRIPVLRLEGAPGLERHRYAALVAEAAGGTAYRIDPAALPAHPGELLDLARRWRRLRALHDAVAVVDVEDAAPDALRVAERFVERLGCPVILVGRAEKPFEARDSVLARAPAADAEARIALWRDALGAALEEAPDAATVTELADRFRLPPDVVRGMARGAAAGPDWRAALLAAARAYGRGRLEGLADWVAPHGGWERLVLQPEVEQPLREMVAQVRLRDVVHRQWGLGGERGASTTALFAGPSGTGKTLAAEVIAAELGLDLYRIDVANVVSKYIGETEKHLGRLFDAAEGSGAVLLFDEADALFGKRGEVRDSHDRHANLEVGYLLQRLERYSGIAVLTTNLREAIDPAFMRRLRFVVDFSFPDEAARARLWDLWLPKGAPRGAIDARELGHVALSGGQIFNVAVNASFLAATDGGRLKADHLVNAIRREYYKTGRTLSESEARAVAAAAPRRSTR